MNENEPMNTTMGLNNNINMNYAPPKKKSGLGLLIIFIIIAAVIAGGVIYVMSLNNPEKMYKKAIETTFDTYTEQVKNIANMESYKAKINLDLDVEFEDEDMVEEEILDLINETKAELGVQLDKKEQKVVVDVVADYEDEDLLDAKFFADIKEEKAYLYVEEFIDKYLELEIEDVDFESFQELLEEEELSSEEIEKFEQAMAIMKKEISNIVKSEYCSSEKSTQKINGKDINTTKNTLEMTVAEMGKELATAFENLKDNEKFLGLVEESEREGLQEILEEAQSALEEMAEEDGTEDASFRINTYTTGLIPKAVKYEVVLLEEDEEVLIFTMTNIEKDKYSLEIEVDEETVMEATLTLTNVNKNGATIKFETEIEEVGKFGVKLGYSEEYNVKIDEIDEDNVAKIEELTEDEQEELKENFEDSKLYELIEDFSGMTTTPTLPSDDTDEPTYPNIDNDEPTIPSIDGNDDTSTTTTSVLEDNQILAYDSKTKITFGIPNGYKTNRISDNFQVIEKDDISIEITTYYGTEDKMYQSLIDSKNYFSQDDYYKNVTLSDKMETTVAGRTFYRATASKESEYSKYTTDHIWSKVSDRYLVDLRIRGMENISAEELEQILTMTVTEN